MKPSDVLDIATVVAENRAQTHPATAYESVRFARERFRLLALRVEAWLEASANRMIVVTSPAVGDGKSVTALHLGATLACDLGHRVVVVDANLRSPKLAPLLGLEPKRGLADLLDGRTTLEEVLWRVGDEDLFLLPGSERAVVTVPIRGLMPTFKRLRSHYEYILVDTPAMSESADALAVARGADGVILVIRSGATRREELTMALDLLQGTPIVGCVVVGNDDRQSWRTARSKEAP